ncbi:hypothetical protein FEF65_01135 [Mariprofundus erugo]|uniref:Uncharacterized protein n=1 Tax=Mariprofundus erugo TaxID=2528639 RepID=A0A5R9GYK5_9PROT|nr:hypothetical protein [Mariprofundus erugo]TLS69123.1 hypothetical protein FEF65_01135 [Mariprofundus erugo]
MTSVWIAMVAFVESWWLEMTAISLLLLLVSLVAMPFVVAQIPADYFVHRRRHRGGSRVRHRRFAGVIAMLKNGLGLLLLFAGAVMLLTPGPGLVTMLAGLMLANYPGKFRLERWLISRPQLFHMLNRMREQQGEMPLLLPGKLFPDGSVQQRDAEWLAQHRD